MASDGLQALLAALAETGSSGATRSEVEDELPGVTAKGLGDMAKGTGAGLAGLPVDLVSAIIRAGGYDVSPEDTVGSSEWFGELMGADPESAQFILGTMLSPDPMDALKLAGMIPALAKRMSRAEAEEAGYWHEIGDNKKLKKPVSELSRDTKPHGKAEEKRVISPEDMQGSILIPAPGDRSDAGKLLVSVGGEELGSPVILEGGHGFMRNNPDSVWASAKGPITTINKKARAAQEAGKDANLVYMPMGHGATDHNTMVTDVLLEQIKGSNISKTAKKLFDRKLRKLRPEWKGIDSDVAHEQLQKTGALRHAFSEVAQLEEFQRRGFPDISEARFAVTDPDLLDYDKVPLHQGGQSIARLTGEVVVDPRQPHKTYDTQAGGEYIGGIEGGVPRDIMFPEFTKARREAGKLPRSDYRSFSLGLPTQDADQEWLDGVMNYLMEAQR
jgi:hypothetical protein